MPFGDAVDGDASADLSDTVLGAGEKLPKAGVVLLAAAHDASISVYNKRFCRDILVVTGDFDHGGLLVEPEHGGEKVVGGNTEFVDGKVKLHGGFDFVFGGSFWSFGSFGSFGLLDICEEALYKSFGGGFEVVTGGANFAGGDINICLSAFKSVSFGVVDKFAVKIGTVDATGFVVSAFKSKQCGADVEAVVVALSPAVKSVLFEFCNLIVSKHFRSPFVKNFVD